MKSRGLLKPPLLFMYCLYFLLVCIFAANALLAPSTRLPLVVSKAAKPITFIISISSSVMSSNCFSSISGISASCWPPLGPGFSGVSLLLLLLGDGVRDLLLRGDLDLDLDLLNLRTGDLDLEWDRRLSVNLLRLSRSLSRSLGEGDLERLLSLLLGDLDLLLPIMSVTTVFQKEWISSLDRITMQAQFS